MTLTHEVFLRRFLEHVLPRGFPRIRYFGFLANRRRGVFLPLCRTLLAAAPPVEAAHTAEPAERLCRMVRKLELRGSRVYIRDERPRTKRKAGRIRLSSSAVGSTDWEGGLALDLPGLPAPIPSRKRRGLGRRAIVVVQHAAQPVTSPDRSTIASKRSIRHDQLVAETLVVSLAMIVGHEFLNSLG